MSHRGGLRPGEQLSFSVITLVLSLSLWLRPAGDLGCVDGGPHPVRSVSIGALLVVLTTAALWRRHIVCAWLRAAGPSRPRPSSIPCWKRASAPSGASHPDTLATRERRDVARRAAGR
jgi:hypothetical protein